MHDAIPHYESRLTVHHVGLCQQVIALSASSLRIPVQGSRQQRIDFLSGTLDCRETHSHLGNSLMPHPVNPFHYLKIQNYPR